MRAALSALSKRQLVRLCRTCSLAGTGPTRVLRERLERHLEANSGLRSEWAGEVLRDMAGL